jgi:hypothetical protein
MPPAAGPYIAAFKLLQEDFRRVGEYISLTDDNLGTYSHRLFELLLRSCTEFESLCKDLLVERGSSKPPRDMNVMDYRSLEGPWHFERVSVGVLTWLPETAYVNPFQGWSSAQPPLPWYASYNQVKHNRHNAFAEASLANVRNAIAGQFALMAEVSLIAPSVGSYQERTARDGRREVIYPGYDFSVVT